MTAATAGCATGSLRSVGGVDFGALWTTQSCADDVRNLPPIGLSLRTLIRRIKHETGMSFRELRRQTRILAALERLSLGESVTNFALNVGFDSPSAFIQAFRDVTGKTPGRYMG